MITVRSWWYWFMVIVNTFWGMSLVKETPEGDVWAAIVMVVIPIVSALMGRHNDLRVD